MAFSTSVRDAAVAEINITPLVDVMLVLLVIFMVSAPMVTRPLDASLPQVSKIPIAGKPSQLLLEVGDEGTYRLDGRPVSQLQLRQTLQDAVVSDPDARLSLRASSNVDYQVMVTALSAARESGIAHIAMQP